MKITTKHDGYSPAGIRIYFKGGGGDPGAEARQQEADRQARISAATETINGIFGGAGRDTLYEDQRKTVRELNSMEVERQATEAQRANKFGLARSGLLGGSVDVDAGQELNRRTNEGLLRAGGIADQSAADLRLADERTRSSLLSMAQSGIDTGSAATQALQGLKANAEQVASQRSGAMIGSLFNDLGGAYLAQQGSMGRAQGAQAPGQQWYGVSSPTQTYGGSTK